MVNTFIFCKKNLWSFKKNDDFMLRNSLFEAVKLTKNADFDKYMFDIALDLVLAKVFHYLIVAALVKT